MDLDVDHLRVRLHPDQTSEFPLCEELRQEGATDYLCHFTPFGRDGAPDGKTGLISSWATRAPEGFNDQDIAILCQILPGLALAVQARLSQDISINLLDTYVGREAGHRILDGEIRRGALDVIASVIFLADLRGFTAMSERAPRNELVDMLNQYFDCLVGPIVDRGGNVLKFLGDGLLATFPLNDKPATDLCEQALDVAVEVLKRVSDLRSKRLAQGKPVMDLDYLFDDALHRHGFQWGDLVDSDIPMWATVTPAEPDDQTRLLRAGESEDHARRVLAASASLPVIAGPSRFIGDRTYIDGGMIEAVPWSSALDLGATHVLVARSRGFNKDGEPEPLNIFERVTVPRLVRRMHGDHVTDIVNKAAERFWNSTESLRAIINGDATAMSGKGRPVVIEAVIPSHMIDLPDRLEVDTHVLMDALTAGAQAMVDHLDVEGFAVEQRVLVTHPRAPVGRIRTTALAPIVSERRRQRR